MRLKRFLPEHLSGVSIHASVKDATGEGDEALGGKNVSIHASVKDATYALLTVGTFPKEFQSTHL